jgi:serine/threonine protein kinase
MRAASSTGASALIFPSSSDTFFFSPCRDLKPENILLSRDMHVKITDFGTATILTAPPAATASGSGARSSSFVGTAQYVSPELLNDKTAGPASDLCAWALALTHKCGSCFADTGRRGTRLHHLPAARGQGAVLWCLSALGHACVVYSTPRWPQVPFRAANEYLTFRKISALEYEFPEGFPPQPRDLVQRLLVLNPADRLTLPALKVSAGAASRRLPFAANRSVSLSLRLQAHAFYAGVSWATLHQQTPPTLDAYLPGRSAGEQGVHEVCCEWCCERCLALMVTMPALGRRRGGH